MRRALLGAKDGDVVDLFQGRASPGPVVGPGAVCILGHWSQWVIWQVNREVVPGPARRRQRLLFDGLDAIISFQPAARQHALPEVSNTIAPFHALRASCP